MIFFVTFDRVILLTVTSWFLCHYVILITASSTPAISIIDALSSDELSEVPWSKTLKPTTRSMLAGTVPAERKYSFRVGREKFQACADNVNETAAQGRCGICHAAACASVLSNRYCIALTEGWLPEERRAHFNDQFSMFQVAACTPYPVPVTDEERSHYARVYKEAAFKGFVTGGGYKSGKGCAPHPFSPVDEPPYPLTCLKPNDPCPNTPYQQMIGKTHEQDLRRVDTFWATNPNLPVNEQAMENMKFEIFSNGPITATVVVFERGVLGPLKGHCTQRVVFNEPSGIFIFDGPAEHTQRVFIGAPAAVTLTKVAKESDEDKAAHRTALLDVSGEGAFVREPGTLEGVRPVKYTCATNMMKSDVELPYIKVGADILIVGDRKTSYWRYTSEHFNKDTAVSMIGDKSAFSQIDAMLYVGDNSVMIFGEDSAGNTSAGLLVNVFSSSGPGIPGKKWKIAPGPAGRVFLNKG